MTPSADLFHLSLQQALERGRIPASLTPNRCILATEEKLEAANEDGDLTQSDLDAIDAQFGTTHRTFAEIEAECQREARAIVRGVDAEFIADRLGLQVEYVRQALS